MLFRKNLFFTIARIVSIFFMGLIVAFVIALSQVNLETLRSDVLGILRGATGLDIEIEGAVSWKFSLRPRIELHQVRVRNAEWARHEYAFSAETIDVTLDLLSLMRDRPTIKNVKINDASICIEKNDAGEYSIMPRSQDAAPASDAAAADADEAPVQPKYPFADPGLGGVTVKNVVLHLLDATYSLSGMDIRYVPRDDAREYAGWIKPADKVYPFIVSYSEYNPERKVYPVRVAISTGGDALIANIALEGTSRAPIDFVIAGDIPDIAAFGAMLNLDLAYMPTMHVNLAGGVGRGKVTLRRSSVLVRGNEIFFSGDYDWTKKRTTFNLNLESREINLMELFPELYMAKRRARGNRELNVFKDIPLFGKEFLTMDMNLRAEIDKLVVYRELSLNDIDLRLRLAGGSGRLDLHTGIGDGVAKASADVVIERDGTLDVIAAGFGENIQVGKILEQVREPDLISGLPMGLRFYLRGRGADLAELMGTATGPVQIYSNGSGYAHSALVANMYGTDFLTSLRHSIQDLFRSEKKHNQIKISCAAISAKVRDGRIETENGVAVETNAINLRLAGNMDFGQESMRLALTTVPVRGLKLSLTGNVMNSIEISGNLAEPDIKISGAAVAGKVASATGIGLLLAPFTGGISLAAGAGIGLLAGDLLENWLADDQPCKTALQRGAPDRRGDPEWLGAPIEDLIGSVMDN
ncbi:MAG: AsmA family protein [Alphaproteobacteria bacterium]|nr:AsmA family protein [Alphaproteobacteria bacterium]